MKAKDAGVRDADEKQELFDRHAEDVDADDVAGVEVPDAPVGEEAVPNEEEGSGEQAGDKEGAPLLEEE